MGSQLTKRARLIPATLKIIEENPSIKLTIRQVFYRLVSKGIICNTRSAYNSLDSQLAKARMKGQVPFTAFVDHARGVTGKVSYQTATPKDVFEDAKQDYEQAEETFNACTENYRLPHWHDQPSHVEVWLEKQALANLFEQVTEKHHVRLLPCKGYPSLTFMYEAAVYLHHRVPKGKHIVILYFGDYDMRGFDIQRDISSKLQGFGLEVNVKRIALTREQIETYRLPPAPAKKLDTMAFGWIETEGDVAWELDALEPKELHQLIDIAVQEQFDWQAYQTRLDQIEEGKERIQQLLNQYNNVYETE